VNSSDFAARRRLLQKIALAASLSTFATAELRAADAPLIAESDPVAKAVKYVEDTKKAKESMGNRCDTCTLYQGASGSAQGGCQIFKGKQVKAAGWCASWAPQM
jgi:hypothetical protein